MSKRLSFLLVGVVAALSALAVSCVHEQDSGFVETPPTNASFSFVINDVNEMVRTKSVLDDNIETKVTGITVAVYSSGGSIVAKKHFISGTDDLNDMRFTLPSGQVYSVFALANMGDMTGAFPSSISGDAPLEDISYVIPSYTSGDNCINALGIPMSGVLSYTVNGDNTTTSGEVPLKRLLAKLDVDLRCDWLGFITSVKVKNLNARLTPFGTSVASSSSDLLGEEEVDVPSSSIKEGGFVFYVPENMLGEIAGIESPEDKQGDDSGDSNPVNAIADRASYLETVITGDTAFGHEGTVTYRSYLGGNSTTDFNIVGNDRYYWSIEYGVDGMVIDDWKHENDMSWKRFFFSRVWPRYVYWDEQARLLTNARADVYESGVLVESDASQSFYELPSGMSFTWAFTPQNYSILSPLYSLYAKTRDYDVYGVAPGIATVRQVINDGYGDNVYQQNIEVIGLKRELFLRTPNGDYYNGQGFNVDWGSNMDVSVGMKITPYNGTPYIICPIRCGQNNNREYNFYNKSSSSTNKYIAIAYDDISGDVNRPMSGNVVFDLTKSATTTFKIGASAKFSDYNSSYKTEFTAEFPYTVNDVSYEEITITGSASAYVNASVGLTGKSQLYRNGSKSGTNQTKTTDAAYRWYMISGPSGASVGEHTGVVTSPVAGEVTVGFQKIDTPSYYATKVVTFNDKVEYRLVVTPKVYSIKVDDSFNSGDVYSFSRLQLINDIPGQVEPYTGSVSYGAPKPSGILNSSYSTATHTETFTGRKVGQAQVIISAANYGSLFSPYKNSKDTVTIIVQENVPDNYVVTLSPSSVSLLVSGETTLGFQVTNNGQPVSVSASDLQWHSKNSAVATVSGVGEVHGVSAGGTAVYATFIGVSSNEVGVTVNSTTTYRYKIVTSLNPSSIKAGGVSVASALRYRKTFESGQAVSGWDFLDDVTSSGFSAVTNPGLVSISGNNITGNSAGNAVIRSNYTPAPDEYENATLSISDADYSVSISPSQGQDLVIGKVNSMSYSAQGTPDNGGSYSWSVSPTNKVSLSASGNSALVSALAPGQVTLTVNYASGKAIASVNFKVYNNSLILGLDKSSVDVNSTNSDAKASVTFSSNDGSVTDDKDVVGIANLFAYTDSTGDDLSDIVSINPDSGVITGIKSGDCWIEASYTNNNISYTSNRVHLRVNGSPLSLAWSSDGSPNHIAQRGLLVVSGLDDGNADVSYTVISGNDKVVLESIGKNTYVALKRAGNYTIKATASNGQEGTFNGNVLGLTMSTNLTTLYANPDGGNAVDNEYGLYSANNTPLRISYKSNSIVMTPVAKYLTSGTELCSDLYNSWLAPRFDCVSSVSLKVYDENNIFVDNLNGYPLAQGETIGTITVSPTVTDIGIPSVYVFVKSVNPFAGLATYRITWNDFNDKSYLSKYVIGDDVSRNAGVFNSEVKANAGFVSWDVNLSGAPNADMKKFFTYNGNYVWFEASETDALPGIGGLCEFRITVTNRYSLQTVGYTVVDFNVIAWGAYGGVATVNNTSTFTVGTGYIGPEAARPSNWTFHSSYSNGDVITVFAGETSSGKPTEATVNILNPGTSLGEVVYSVTSNTTLNFINVYHVYRSMLPHVYSLDTNSPSYYLVKKLEEIQDKPLHGDWSYGWIVSE